MDYIVFSNIFMLILNLLICMILIFLIALEENQLKINHYHLLYKVRKRHNKLYSCMGLKAFTVSNFNDIEALLNIFHMGIRDRDNYVTK